MCNMTPFIIIVFLFILISKLRVNKNTIIEKDIIIEYDESIIFNVNSFNEWFNDPLNGALYAHSGIYLRLDKLSEDHIVDYLEKKWNIKNNGIFMWSLPAHTMIKKFYDEIRIDWKKQIYF